MTKAAKHSPAVCVPGTSRSAPSLGLSCRASDRCQRLLPTASSRAAGPPCLLKVTVRGPCSKYKVLMGSCVPASPPPPSAGGLCLLLVREPSVPWLWEMWEGAGAVRALLVGAGLGLYPGRMLQGSRASAAPAALSWEAAAQLLCSALPFEVPTWREVGALLGEQPGFLTLPAPSAQGERE